MPPCPSCGFVYGETPRQSLAGALTAHGPQFAERLASGTPRLAHRRSPGEWSPLEYGCHIRDVFLMQRDRLYVALVEEEPSFKPMYREERVGFDGYARQDPGEVGRQVVMAASLIGNAFAGLSDEQWARTLVYNFPEPSHRDVEWMAHHTLHEAVHHLSDMDDVLGEV